MEVVLKEFALATDKVGRVRRREAVLDRSGGHWKKRLLPWKVQRVRM